MSGSRLRKKPSRNRLMAVVETVGITRAKSAPVAGQRTIIEPGYAFGVVTHHRIAQPRSI
jgi:hypothetical protein